MIRRFILPCLFATILVAAVSGLALLWSPHATAQATCTYSARLVSQSMTPDAGPLAPGADFAMTWTLRNDGDCPWTDAMRVVLVSGNRMGSARAVRLATAVAPTADAIVTLSLTAPDEPGEYTGTWRLRSPDGQRFGPSLAVEVTVGVDGQEGAVDDVVLPAVLAFGGRGGGGDDGATDPCVQADGSRFVGPGYVLDDEYLADYRYLTLYLCGFDTDAELTVTLTNPLDDIFVHTYVVPEAKTFVDAGDRTYAQTVVSVPLRWLDQAPSGNWDFTVSDGDREATGVMRLVPPVPLPVGDFGPVPTLQNWPEAPIDPVLVSQGCNYAYTPGQTLFVAGTNLPANTRLPIGVYQERLYEHYLIDSHAVTTEDDGTFLLSMQAPDAPGNYILLSAVTLVEEGYQAGEVVYEVGYGDVTAQRCLTVLPDPDVAPWRLAMAQGVPGRADIVALDLFTGYGAYPTYNSEQCDAADPTWWPGGEWIVYASNCVEGPLDEFGFPTKVVGSYDLYAHELQFGWEDEFGDEPPPEPIALTLTPEWDETEAHVDVDGWIVYRRAPAGSALDEDGDLWVLDALEQEFYDLDERGRAPVWSPDSSRIAFMSARSGRWQIYVYDLVSGDVTLVSTNCQTHCRYPSWSPDGTRLVYSVSESLRDFTPSGLWMASAAGTGRPRLWLAGIYGRPNWSATGWIAFHGVDGIYRAHADARVPVAERYLYSTLDISPYWAAAWSR